MQCSSTPLHPIFQHTHSPQIATADNYSNSQHQSCTFHVRYGPFCSFHITISFSCDVYRGLGARYRLCMDLVESEEAFRPALSYALGAALVCDSLEDAQELCFTKGEKVGAL